MAYHRVPDVTPSDVMSYEMAYEQEEAQMQLASRTEESPCTMLFQCNGFVLDYGTQEVYKKFIQTQEMRVDAGSRGRMRRYMTDVFERCFQGRELYRAALADGRKQLEFFEDIAGQVTMDSKYVDAEILMQLVDRYSTGRVVFHRRVESSRGRSDDDDGDMVNSKASHAGELPEDSEDVADDRRDEDLIDEDRPVEMAVVTARQLRDRVDRWNVWLDETIEKRRAEMIEKWEVERRVAKEADEE
ncbi:tryptophan--tRNA ligase [Hypoxylon texense]